MLQMIHKGTLTTKDVLEEWAKQAMALPDLEIDLGRLLEIKEDEPSRLLDVDAGGLHVKVHIDCLISSKRAEIETLFTSLQHCSTALYGAHERLQTFNPLRDKVVEEAPIVGAGGTPDGPGSAR